ncbi:MAG: threonine--tRNA ligase [Proteobacteria bacterium]|uniref:Threonine--tRNA ligase n=1 Tax=Candidatus Enterousia excrementavium TaxID=2840789 RepID=A0A940IC53_9PROT|nr:threonine--tRNA ligase [Candidatus Enterousia excrementavium]
MSYPIETIRHSLAHVLAAAVKKLYPDVKFAGGPAIENGFYYDFDTEHRFSEDDFEKIEREMRDLIKSNGRFEQRNVSLDEAKEIFASQPYKMEWLNEYDAAGEALSIYTFRDFVDLCRGPHVESSKDLPRDAFKIRNVAGAYWKGDAKNKMLQRIYVDAFASKEELDEFLKMQAEAAARDNRKLGKEMDLFHFEPDYAPGAVFWHDKGYKIYRKLIEYLRHRQERAGYQEISTPSVMDRSLWERSGHWAKYGEHNYSGKTQDGKTFCVKPMSCPGGMLVFGQGIKSYKDLPLYLAEFGKVCRYEAAGGLSGLMRVREFTQDDAHIFCTEDQLEAEVVKILRFIKDIYAKFGFNNISMKLATRKESEFRIGSDDIWDKAEGALKHALDANGIEYEIAPGDAAFYGPKIDNYLKDALGRTWQCGTVQLDMNLPERFDLSYIGEDGEKHRPIMLHRALVGSIERFMGVLLESTGGNLPLWLSPEPVVVTPISEKFREYAVEVANRLRDAGVYARADLRDEKVNYKIRELSLAKTPIIAVVGEKEMENKTVTLRRLGVEKQETVSMDEFVSQMRDAVKMPA